MDREKDSGIDLPVTDNTTDPRMKTLMLSDDKTSQLATDATKASARPNSTSLSVLPGVYSN